jgi:hypothetical protein
MAQPAIAEVTQDAPIIVTPTTKRARIKGTWVLYYGGGVYDFVDGQSYDLSPELYDYLRSTGNIYDTIA